MNKLESPSPQNVMRQIWLELTQRFWRRFLNFVNVFSLFRNYLPLEKGWALQFEQTWILMTQKGIVPSLVEIGPVVLEKKFFLILSMYFRYFFISPLGKGWGPSFEQTWILFTQGCNVLSLIEIGRVVLKKQIFKFCQCIFAIL